MEVECCPRKFVHRAEPKWKSTGTEYMCVQTAREFSCRKAFLAWQEYNRVNRQPAFTSHDPILDPLRYSSTFVLHMTLSFLHAEESFSGRGENCSSCNLRMSPVQFCQEGTLDKKGKNCRWEFWSFRSSLSSGGFPAEEALTPGKDSRKCWDIPLWQKEPVLERLTSRHACWQNQIQCLAQKQWIL